MESSAPMVTVWPSPWPSSPAFVELGSLPSASTLTTMSRSVSMPLSRSSSPQIGMAPTSSSLSFLAASSTESFSPMQVHSPVITSRAFLSDMLPPKSTGLWRATPTQTDRAGRVLVLTGIPGARRRRPDRQHLRGLRLQLRGDPGQGALRLGLAFVKDADELLVVPRVRAATRDQVVRDH